MNVRNLLTVLAIGCTVPVWAGLDFRESDGTFQVWRNGERIVSSIVMDRGAIGTNDVERSFVTLPDGSRVWNEWSKVGDRSFRFEVAARSDGAVELTMQSQVAWDSTHRDRWLTLTLPESVLTGQAYTSVVATVRKFEPVGAVFAATSPELKSRWLATNGLTFDFNALGPGDDECCDSEGWSHQDSLRGAWYVRHLPGGGWKIFAGACPPTPWGGYIGAKLVLREGRFEDYDSLHAIRDFYYGQRFYPQLQLAFGAPRFGETYRNGDHSFADAKRCGWKSKEGETRAVVGHPEGVSYSALTGCGKAVYRISGLRPGVLFLTFTAGNYSGVDNDFSVLANGEPVRRSLQVPARQVFVVTRPIQVSGDHIDVELSGRWLLSSLAVQPLLHAAEDFSIRRGIWLTDGWEPTYFHRNDTVKAPAKFAVEGEFRPLPVPGEEYASQPRELTLETELPDPDLPSLAWTRNPRIVRIFNNSSTMSELDPPGALEAYFDREIAGRGYNVVMLSGMHSRHTYAGQRQRGLEAVKRIAAEAHRRGMKLIDHFDATLVWNIGEGFRVMTERLPELIRSKETGLPSYQFCPYNPVFKQALHDYLVQEVRNGVDGFQVDEVQFWKHGCVCRHCREGFHRDTGWYVPENELDPAWKDRRSPFMKRWFDWKVKQSTDFFLELRRKVKDIRPDLVLSCYSTPWAFQYPVPLVNNGRSISDMARTFNLFGLEVMSRCVMRSTRFELSALRVEDTLSPDGRLVMWDWYYNADWQNDYVAWAISAMTGRSPMLAEVEKGPEVPDYPTFGEARGGMRRRGARPLGTTALLFSYASRDWNADDVFFAKEYGGFAQALDALHVPYVVIDERSLTEERLRPFKTLIVGAAHCLSEKSVAAIRAFAERGGIVRLSAQAGLFDERGDRREAWPFRDVFGLEPSVGSKTGTYLVRPFGRGELRYTPDLKGEEFFMLYENVGAPCAYKADPLREAAFRREVGELADSWWRVEAPEKVHTALWREADGSVVIHFLNVTGVKTRAGDVAEAKAPSPAFPPLERDIVFTVPEGTVAVAVSPDFAGARELESEKASDGSLTVTLPKELLNVYTLIRIR